MQRNYLRGLLICLVPCLLASLFAIRLDRYKLGIDLAGGTILVYEINLERTKQRNELANDTAPRGGSRRSAASGPTEGLKPEQMAQLASEIKRRIDPTDIKNVTVRPLGDTRVEIILPIGGAASAGKSNLTNEEIEEVKRLIGQMGVLEFRILANGTDDIEAITRAREAVEKAPPEDLLSRAKQGLAPEAPPEEFTVDIGEAKGKVRYAWTELGKEERESLGLQNDQEGKAGIWGEAALARAGGKVFYLRDKGATTPDPTAAWMVLYSREVKSNDKLAKEAAEVKALTDGGKTKEEAERLVNPKKYEYFVLSRVGQDDSLRVGGDVTLNATLGQDKAFNVAIDFQFNGAGAQAFGKITRRNKPTGGEGGFKRTLAILLDDQVVSAASIISEITSHGQITGKFERSYVERIVQILRSGALSAELKEKAVSENTIGPTLGRDTIQKGTTAVALAFAAILVFMVVYYRFAGVVACVALFANLLLTVGFMVSVNAAFTLAGLAGLVLTLGMAVDANVLIYERLREERSKGANIATAIRNGYDRAFPTIIDTHLTSIFTAIVLYTTGNDNLKGFAISLTVGLVISLFTSLYMTRLMFDFWQHKRWLTDLSMMRLFGKLGFHPMKYRHFFFLVTGVSSLVGLSVFLLRGQDGLNVDFRGGTVFAGRLKDGEERALTKTGDGKLGFRELLSEPRQADRLKVERDDKNKPKVRWENDPIRKDGESDADWAARVGSLNTFVYTITYADKTTATVTLSHKPGKPDDFNPDTLAEDVAARAEKLPDVSVEQTYLSGESYPDGKSRRFTIRTTERQPELVRTNLDRLLREEGDAKKTLMAGATIANIEVKGAVATLTFTEPASRSYVQELLDREFQKARATVPGESFKLDTLGDPKDGRFEKMSVDVSKNPTFATLAGPKPDKGQADSFASILQGTKQAFDAAPEPLRLEVFDSQLAKETRDKALVAIVLSWLAILIYLWFRFGSWTFGLAAVLCLVHDLCFTLGAIAACHYLHVLPGMGFLGLEDFKIDLAAVAALLTLVGYSVSDTIVVFDRIREVRGKNPKLTTQMIDDSVNQTLSRTILTAATVFLVSIVLYVFGGEGVHLFAFVMVMGVLVGTYSSIFVAAPLLLIFGEGSEHPTHAMLEQEAAAKEETEEEVLEG